MTDTRGVWLTAEQAEEVRELIQAMTWYSTSDSINGQRASKALAHLSPTTAPWERFDIVRALDELEELRPAHAALLGVVRDAVRELRETVPPASFQSVTHGQRAINAIRALADAAAAEPRDEEGGE